MPDMPALTPAETAEVDQQDRRAQDELDQFVAGHRRQIADWDPVTARACLTAYLDEQFDHEVLAVLAALAVDRLARQEPTDA